MRLYITLFVILFLSHYSQLSALADGFIFKNDTVMVYSIENGWDVGLGLFQQDTIRYQIKDSSANKFVFLEDEQFVYHYMAVDTFSRNDYNTGEILHYAINHSDSVIGKWNLDDTFRLTIRIRGESFEFSYDSIKTEDKLLLIK